MLLVRRRVLSMLPLVMLLACGGKQADPAPSDHIDGFPLPTVAVANSQSISINSSSQYTCAAPADATFANSQELFMNLGEAFVAGKTYPVQTGDLVPGYALARYDTWGDACKNGDALHAVSGSITVTALAALSVSGKYDLTFDNGDRIASTFTATVCQQSMGKSSCAP